LEHWREAWACHVNQRLAELDIDARIDHRSLEAQGIALEPQHKIGPAAQRRAEEGLEADRLEEHREIARSNGERIIADPKLALDAITRQQATFTNRDLAVFIHSHTDGKDQFDQAMSAVRSSPDLVALGQDGRGQDRFTSREMIAVEERLHRATALMPGLAVETAGGNNKRAVRVLQLEAEIRADPALRADRFVERWQGFVQPIYAASASDGNRVK
jgi:ATP-dependent exoDNAse (exonuclease V) alpha subunit